MSALQRSAVFSWRVTALVILAAASRNAVAQDPVRLPGVVIKGNPGPGRLLGVVRDSQQFPIDGVEVFIPTLRRRTHSNIDGTFPFDSLPKGTFEIWARKIGYRPQIQTVRVGAEGVAVDFELGRVIRPLPAVVTNAERGGLAGVVADTAFRVMPGALVRVMGQGRTVETDSLGTFFFPLRSGNYLISISRKGYGDRIVSVTIPPDSGRRILAYLEPVTWKPNKWIALDLAFLMAWSKKGRAGFFTRLDLDKHKIEWVYQAVQMMGPQFHMMEAPDPICAVIVDGRKLEELQTLTTENVDSIEIFNYHNSNCPLIYVWTR